MNDEIKQALLEMFSIREDAKMAQKQRGHLDQGERSSVTAGKHLDPLAGVIGKELINAGVKKDELYVGNSDMELPGWFRPTKRWDILAFSNGKLIEAIELKSIAGSYGNNFNNRTEEALGSATDANAAVKYKMFGNVTPPAFGYVMVVKEERASREIIEKVREPHFNVDSVFYNNSYIDRFTVMCERLLQEKLYEAVWLVIVNPETQKIVEPAEALSYEKFMIRMKAQVELFT